MLCIMNGAVVLRHSRLSTRSTRRFNAQPGYPMKLIRFVAPIAILAMAACAQAPVQPEPVAVAVKPLPKVVAQPPAPAPRVAPLPNVELSEALLFKLTLAEVALQRGQPHVAVAAFRDAVERSGATQQRGLRWLSWTVSDPSSHGERCAP